MLGKILEGLLLLIVLAGVVLRSVYLLLPLCNIMLYTSLAEVTASEVAASATGTWLWNIFTTYVVGVG
jgi:ABC-type spermidine/putrescine transport system permease subunit I